MVELERRKLDRRSRLVYDLGSGIEDEATRLSSQLES